MDTILGARTLTFRRIDGTPPFALARPAQTQSCTFTWPKYLRQASVSADRASRIWSSKLARLCALLFVSASCWSSTSVKRLEASLHCESSSSRSKHLPVGSAISVFVRCSLRSHRTTTMEDQVIIQSSLRLLFAALAL